MVYLIYEFPVNNNPCSPAKTMAPIFNYDMIIASLAYALNSVLYDIFVDEILLADI